MPDHDHLLAAETARRRTFAIIAHPDAGKTTLTEKLLLYAGLLRTAGMVKNRKSGKAATSDWMTMEQERGISITASAMQFEYKGCVINVLDTPGHQDFCEDTYRTLTAADTAIMVLDAAKGVEAQTRKLFAACRLRGIPVLTFINKCDLPGRSPLDLLAEVEEVLGIQASALNWPTGTGQDFVGVIDRQTRELIHFRKASAGGALRADLSRMPLQSSQAAELLGTRHPALGEELELLQEAGNPFSMEAFRAGQVTPVFFGSAFTNFGIEPFYDAFIHLALPPHARPAKRLDGTEILVDPIAQPFSAYVFKIQANMDPRHRDSLAFIRIVSGRFGRDMVVRHYSRGSLVREVRLSRPQTLVARDRTTLDDAFPGDVVGLVTSGFAIGDTISLGSGPASEGFEHAPLPQFTPECFARVRPKDLTKRKAFDKGLEQLTREGTVQLLFPWKGTQGEPIVAAVGRLQFDVLLYRLKDEYAAESDLIPQPFTLSSWIEGDPETLDVPYGCLLARASGDRPVLLCGTQWDRDYAMRQNPQHVFKDFA